MSGDPRFKKLLDEMWELHNEKAEGYGSDEDPLANLRDASEWGLQDYMGAFLRAGDKFQRLKNHIRKGNIPGDSLHNDARDGAAYLLLGLILWEEQNPQPSIAELVEDVQRTLRGEVLPDYEEEIPEESDPIAESEPRDYFETEPEKAPEGVCYIYDHVTRQRCMKPSGHGSPANADIYEPLHDWQEAKTPTT